MNDQMGYDYLAQEALRDVIRLALEKVAENGLPGEHRIFIKFRTRAEGVVLPKPLLEKYPDEITIVLKQHFWDLKVGRDSFSVGLSFNQQPESLTVPYRAVLQFFDPAPSFIINFPEAPPQTAGKPRPASPGPVEADPVPTRLDVPTAAIEDNAAGQAEVVSLDAFRKK